MYISIKPALREKFEIGKIMVQERRQEKKPKKGIKKMGRRGEVGYPRQPQKDQGMEFTSKHL